MRVMIGPGWVGQSRAIFLAQESIKKPQSRAKVSVKKSWTRANV